MKVGSRADLEHLVEAVVGLLAVEEPHALARRAVELARDAVGLVRVSIYLVDHFKDLLSGTWASDSRGTIVDEHNVMYALGNTDRKALAYDRRGVPYTVFQKCLIVEDRPKGREVAARGWVACTPIRCGKDIVGLVFNDAGPSQATFDQAKQAELAMLCSVLGPMIRCATRMRSFGGQRGGGMRTHRLVMRAVAAVTQDLRAGVADIARRLGTGPRHLERAFDTQLGVSLLEYRDRMRLHRVAVLIGARRASLPDAVVAAGFDSCAHFQRVQRTFRWMRWLNRLGS